MLLTPSATDKINRKRLPESVGQCHDLIGSLLEDLDDYKGRVDYLSRRLFGQRSERIEDGPGQLDLFDEVEVVDNAEDESEPDPEQESEAPLQEVKAHTRHGRKPLPKDLPRISIEHDLSDEEKQCAECGELKQRIGQEVSERLDYQPASLHVVERIQIKYACPCCKGQIALAEKPAQPIEKGLAEPGLLAHILTSKYCDHLPLNRQVSILARHGVDLSRSTLSDWVLQSAQALSPLVDAMKKEILKSFVIHTDDTSVPVQQKSKTHKSYLWVYLGDDEHPYTFYDFTWTRSREGPDKILSEFRGYLQADAYPGYDKLFSSGRIFEVACWAHARRKFFDAKSTDPLRANLVMNLIRKLYAIERKAREAHDGVGMTADERFELRAIKAPPILAEILEILREDQMRVLPKSPIGKAINYALNNWDALICYLEDGRLAIDNNPAERAMRNVVIGRKNWLFAGSQRGGHAAATIYSLIASAKRSGLDPFVYLRDVLIRISSHPRNQISDLFPDNWHPS